MGLCTRTVLTGLGLCAGIGGIELGLRLALGDAYRAICYVEREASAAAVIVARMADKALDEAPVWDDLDTFDGKPWRGVGDIVTAGYPCQPFSCAGKRLADRDPRHLWPSIARIIAEVEPPFVFLENVPTHLALGFDAVKAELEGLGYRVEAGLFTAVEVGAPHLRQRLFVLAYRNGLGDDERHDGDSVGRISGAIPRRQDCTDTEDSCTNSIDSGNELADGSSHRLDGRGLYEGSGKEGPGARDPYGQNSELAETKGGHTGKSEGGNRRKGTGGGSSELAHPASLRGRAIKRGEPHGDCESLGDLSGHRRGWNGQALRISGTDETLADTQRAGTGAGDQGIEGAERERRGGLANDGDEFAPFPPGPTDFDAWARILESSPHLEPAICRVDDGVPAWLVEDVGLSRPDQLRALGNAVVPLVAAFAFTYLVGQHTLEGALGE